MNHAVIWTPNALAGLAMIWTRAANKQTVNAAENRIDRLLAADPKRNGAPLTEGLYVLNAKPLRAVYTISDALRRVTIESVNEIH